MSRVRPVRHTAVPGTKDSVDKLRCEITVAARGLHYPPAGTNGARTQQRPGGQQLQGMMR